MNKSSSESELAYLAAIYTIESQIERISGQKIRLAGLTPHDASRSVEVQILRAMEIHLKDLLDMKARSFDPITTN